MKILYLITKSSWGGASRHVFDLAVAAKKTGQEVTVALGGEGVLRDRLREEGITTRPISKLQRDIDVGAEWSSFWEIFKIIGETKPDILHLHSTKAGGLGALAGRLRGVKKIIFTAHGWAFNEDRPLMQKVGIIIASWVTMLLCTHIINLSEKELAQAESFPLVKEKMRMVRLGIQPPTFYSKMSAVQFFQSKTTESLNKKFIIGTNAELHPNKGLFYAINAIEKLSKKHKNFMYFIISDGEQREFLEKLIKEKGLENFVKLLGFVPHAAEYLRGLDLFLLTSVKEGLPYVLLEAGCAGLPVVATTVGGIPELIEDMQSGILIQPKKSDEIAHAIEFLMEHKGIQREYARNLQERVKNLFNIEQMLAGTFKIYTETANTRPQ